MIIKPVCQLFTSLLRISGSEIKKNWQCLAFCAFDFFKESKTSVKSFAALTGIYKEIYERER